MHVGLNDGFELSLHGRLLRHASLEVVHHEPVFFEVVNARRFLAVEEQHVVALCKHVHAVQIGHFIVERGGKPGQIVAKGDERMLVTQMSQDGGHDVDLLDDARQAPRFHVARGVEEDNRHPETPERRLIFLMCGEAGVIGRDDEKRVLVPRLTARRRKEFAQGHVAVSHALVECRAAFFGKLLFVAFRHLVGGVGRGGENGRHERLFHFAHLLRIVLQERFVPDGPCAVELLFAAETRVGVKLCAAIVTPEARGPCKGLEAHRAVLRTVEESRLIALLVQLAGQSAQVVERGGGEEKRFDKHRYRRKHRGHAVDALAPVGKGVLVGGALPDERIEEGGYALVASAFELWVERPDKFLAETLENDHHHILVARSQRIARAVEGRIEGIQFVGRVVGRIDKGLLVRRSDHGEGRIQHQCGFGRAVDKLIGVAERDGAHGRGESAAHAGHTKGNEQSQRKDLRHIVGSGGARCLGERARVDISHPKQGDERHADEQNDGVVQHFFPYDGQNVALIPKFAENGPRGAATGVLEIDRVGHIQGDAHAIDEDIEPFAHRLPAGVLFVGHGQEHEQSIQGIGVENGGGVEEERTFDHQRCVELCKARGKGIPVGHEEGQATERIDDVDQQEIEEEGQGHGERTEAEGEAFHWLCAKHTSRREKRGKQCLYARV